jgi:DNA-binding CsgD family transcriptional regulator
MTAHLTGRERQVVALLAQGKTSKETALLLGLRPETVGTHRKHICQKLDVHSTAELIQRACQILNRRDPKTRETLP